jgi:hypothetical protein
LNSVPALLASTTICESESTQKADPVKLGQIPTKLYPHPKCAEIAAAEDGTVWTLWTKGKNQNNPPKLTDNWRLIDTYCGAKFRNKQSIALPAPVARQIVTGKTHYRVLAGRFNLECYLGRTLKEHEVCCHGPLGNNDHSKQNLTVDCQLNNIIDEVVAGRITTTPESLQRAINRLNELLNLSTKVNGCQI